MYSFSYLYICKIHVFYISSKKYCGRYSARKLKKLRTNRIEHIQYEPNMHICKFELPMHASAVTALAWAPHTGTFLMLVHTQLSRFTSVSCDSHKESVLPSIGLAKLKSRTSSEVRNLTSESSAIHCRLCTRLLQEWTSFKCYYIEMSQLAVKPIVNMIFNHLDDSYFLLV